MILQWILTHDLSFETRCRKVGQWLDRRGVEWMVVTDKRQLKEALKLRPEAIHVHELDALVELMRLGRPNARIIYEAHEYERGLPYGQDWRLKADRELVPLVDEMIVASPAIARQTEIDHGFAPHVIANSPMRPTVDRHSTLIRDACGAKPGDRVVVFCGSVTGGRGLETLVEALRILGRRWKIVLMGNMRMSDYLRLSFEQLGAMWLGEKPYPHPGVDGPTMLDWLAGADVGINLVDRTVTSYRLTFPNKFFEYAFSGVPVVSNSDESVRSLTWDYGLGVMAPVVGNPESAFADAPALAEAIGRAPEVEPMTDDFINAWCWENQGCPVLDEVYSLV